MKKGFFIKTLGCKVNQVESVFIGEALGSAGFFPSSPEEASLLILNSCVVTEKAEAECRKILKKWAKLPARYLVLAGCYSQRFAKEAKAWAEKQGIKNLLILGHQEKLKLPEILKKLEQTHSPKFPVVMVGKLPEKGPCEVPLLKSFPSHSRAFVKVQDGCNRFCSYCIVPFTRGAPRSVPPELVLKQIELFVQAGYEEFVITGIHLGKWGKDLSPRQKLINLLEAIENLLSSFKKTFHLRLSSIEVKELDKELLDFFKSSKFIVPHFHIPLQSGSNRILKLMGRDYTREEYLVILKRLHDIFPSATFGADVMVGFPTETEEDFEETYKLISNSPLNWLHIFSFSPRPGTKAWGMKPKVNPEEIKKRYQALKRLFVKKRKEFLENQKGKVVSAVLEKSSNKGWKALSENYITLYVKGLPENPELKGKLVKVKLVEITEELHFISYPV